MSTQIDLENLFSDPKNMPEFIPDYSIDEIDQALNDALAEINENQPTLEEPQTSFISTPKAELMITSTSSENGLSSNNKEKAILNDTLAIEQNSNIHRQRPLSPESLLSDTSVFNSPRLESKQLDQSQVYESIACIKSQIIDSHNTILSYQTLKNAYMTKCNDLERIMKELQKSEMMRLKLMEENKQLKKVVTSLAVNE